MVPNLFEAQYSYNLLFCYCTAVCTLCIICNDIFKKNLKENDEDLYFLDSVPYLLKLNVWKLKNTSNCIKKSLIYF